MSKVRHELPASAKATVQAEEAHALSTKVTADVAEPIKSKMERGAAGADALNSRCRS
jgi:hypothetical protein